MSSTNYRELKDSVVYNIHYAPTYRAEDATDLAQERDTILQYLAQLRVSTRSAFRLTQLDFAREEIDKAFAAYSSGKDGQRHMEDALGLIERAEKGRPPRTDFIVKSDGTIETE